MKNDGTRLDGDIISSNNHDSYSTLSYSDGTNSYEQPSTSDDSGIAQILERRFVEATKKAVKRRKLTTTSSYQFENIVNKLIEKSNRIKNGLDVASLWSNKFENSWKDKYKSELEFDKKIFELVGEMFEPNPEGIDQDYIVVRINNENNWAIALGRQISKRGLGFPDRLGISSSKSQNDHACVLFKRKDAASAWELYACTSHVEFKMIDTMPNFIVTKDLLLNEMFIVQLAMGKGFGPVFQALSYSISQVWPSLRRIGRENLESIPLTIIGGTRKKPKKGGGEGGHIRFLSGELTVPKHCGGQFCYKFDRIGLVDDDGVCQEAMALYFETLLKGFEHDFAQDPRMPPKPLSGLSLLLTEDNEISTDDFTCFLTAISKASFRQGDFWRGNLVLQNLQRCKEKYKENLVLIQNSSLNVEEETKVIVKVASDTIHGGLISSSATYLALSAIETELSDYGSALVSCVQLSQAGLVVVMKDLSETHREVRMEEEGRENILRYWEGFEALVKGLLLPAANKHVCFVDLRMGYDLLSNVMVKENADGSVRWELIDFNSFSKTVPSVHSDDRYPDVYKPLTYVYVQVMLLGLYWMFEFKQHSGLVPSICRDLSSSFGIDRNTSVDETALKHLMAYFHQVFSDGKRETKPFEIGAFRTIMSELGYAMK